MASRVLKPLALAFALIAGASVQTLALAAAVDGPRRIEVGFSPEGSAQKLVLRTIEVANSSIRLSAYVFTNPDVTRALIAAKQRGSMLPLSLTIAATCRNNARQPLVMH